jgi:hypothetical protein
MQTITSHHPYGDGYATEVGYILDQSDIEDIAESLGITVSELEENEDLYTSDIDTYVKEYDERYEEALVDRMIDNLRG